MEPFLSALEAIAVIQSLRVSLYAYPLLNAGHLLGMAALFGAILVLDLRLLGLWRGVDLDAIGRPAVAVAAAGLAAAVVTGGLLFAVRAGEYAASAVFWTKIAFVGLGVANAAGMRFSGGDRRFPVVTALVSLVAWSGAIVFGRLIGYFGD